MSDLVLVEYLVVLAQYCSSIAPVLPGVASRRNVVCIANPFLHLDKPSICIIAIRLIAFRHWGAWACVGILTERLSACHVGWCQAVHHWEAKDCFKGQGSSGKWATTMVINH